MATHMRWSEALFGTGVPIIDRQHQELFGQINELLDACSRAEGTEKLRSTLEFLGDYIDRHFKEEEALMAERQCSVVAENKAEHDGFRARYAEMCARLVDCKGDVQGAALVEDVQETICDWLTSHIMGVDTKLKNAAG